jgi:hypothetical protein
VESPTVGSSTPSSGTAPPLAARQARTTLLRLGSLQRQAPRRWMVQPSVGVTKRKLWPQASCGACSCRGVASGASSSTSRRAATRLSASSSRSTCCSRSGARLGALHLLCCSR